MSPHKDVSEAQITSHSQRHKPRQEDTRKKWPCTTTHIHVSSANQPHEKTRQTSQHFQQLSLPPSSTDPHDKYNDLRSATRGSLKLRISHIVSGECLHLGFVTSPKHMPFGRTNTARLSSRNIACSLEDPHEPTVSPELCVTVSPGCAFMFSTIVKTLASPVAVCSSTHALFKREHSDSFNREEETIFTTQLTQLACTRSLCHTSATTSRNCCFIASSASTEIQRFLKAFCVALS